MRSKNIIAVIFLLNNYFAIAQFNNVWCFGDSAGIDFNNVNPIPIPITTSLDVRGSCSSIADSLGTLLLYAQTSYKPLFFQGYLKLTALWNKQNQLMQNGDSIVGRGWYKEIIIIPNTSNLFYLFTAGVTSVYGFFYSVIDINQNNGLGAVIQKNVQLQGSGFPANDGIAAIKHGNGRDWWVIIRQCNFPNNEYYFYLITPSGVILDHIQNIGELIQTNSFRIEPSNDGRRIACVSFSGHLAVYDFDRCSGYLSNELLIEPQVSNANFYPWYWDCELSPNNSLLYVSSNYTQNDSNSYLFQYNLNDASPSLTRDTLFNIKQPIVGGMLELAPDNKIYWSCNYDVPGIFPYPYPDTARNVYNENLSVINYPDSLGTACDFQPFSFYLGGKRTYYGLPNNPNYELGPDSSSICDTLTVGIQYPELTTQNSQLFVFYHSDWQTVFINAKGLKGKLYNLSVTDLLGHNIYKETGKLNSAYYTHDLHLAGYVDGLYIISLVTDEEVLSAKFMKL